jgi:hypothetical protein
MATAATGLNPGTTSSATLNTLPDWYEQYGQAVTGQGMGMLGGLSSYQGAVGPDGQPMPRVAGLDPSQTQATQQVQNQQGQFMPTLQSGIGATQTGLGTAAQGTGALQTAGQYLPQAQQQLQAGGSTYNAGEQSAYMNPYIDNVVNRIGTLGNRNLTENVLPQVNSTFTGAGQFGSTRNADFNLRGMRDNQEAISGAQGTALMQAQTQANDQYAQEKNRQLQSGQALGGLTGQATNLANGYSSNAQTQGSLGSQLGSLSTTGQTMNINDNNALLTTGGLNQNTQQKSLDAAYQDFIDRRDYPLAALGGLSQVLPNVSGRITPNTQSTSVTQAPTTDPLQNWSNLVNQINMR